jgi:hypothetical protein
MLLYFGDRTQLAGLPWYTGSVSSTETTALTFTGNDSEYFFSVLEPHLVANEICAGALPEACWRSPGSCFLSLRGLLDDHDRSATRV